MDMSKIRKIARLKNPGSGWLVYSLIACGIVLILGLQYLIGLAGVLPFTGTVALLSFAGCAFVYYRETSTRKPLRGNGVILPITTIAADVIPIRDFCPE
jgi:hypothetical protein